MDKIRRPGPFRMTRPSKIEHLPEGKFAQQAHSHDEKFPNSAIIKKGLGRV